MNMKKTYSGIARSTSGRLRRPERGEPTSPTASGAALKRSFEVEEDTSTNPSPLSRRTTNPLRSSGTSSSSRFHDLRSLNSEPMSRHASDSSSNQRSPKSSLRRVELSGGRVPETVSRRTEISIDISSKQVDSSPSPGIARFGLKRPEVSLQSKATDAPLHRRAEGNHSRAQEPPAPPRRADPPVSTSRIPELSQRRAEPPSPLDISAPSRRAEMHVNRQLSDTQSPARESENSFTSAASITPTFNEYKTPPSVHEAPIRPLERSEVTSSYSSSSSSSSSIMADSVISEIPPTMCLEKPSIDFSYVGIDAILEQMRRKAMKQGFELNIMVVGQSGLGKSTLMNTLFKSKVSRKSFMGTAEEKIPKTIEIKSVSHDIEEKGFSARRPQMMELVQRCGDRYHIQQRSRGPGARRSVTELMEKVEQMLKEGGGGFYDCSHITDPGDAAQQTQLLETPLLKGPTPLPETPRHGAQLRAPGLPLETLQEVKEERVVTAVPLGSVWQRARTAAGSVPQLLLAGALAGAVLGIWASGAVGGAVGAALGSALTHFTTQTLSKHKTH